MIFVSGAIFSKFVGNNEKLTMPTTQVNAVAVQRRGTRLLAGKRLRWVFDFFMRADQNDQELRWVFYFFYQNDREQTKWK